MTLACVKRASETVLALARSVDVNKGMFLPVSENDFMKV
jgi:hypothetical protein